MSRKRVLFHIRPKMIFYFLFTGLVPLLITGYLGSSLAKEALLDQSFDNLKVIQELRSGEVKDSLKRMVEEIQRLPDLTEIKNLSRSINEYQKREGVSGNMILDLPEYKEQRKGALRFLKNEAEAYHFDDFYIICADHGDVLLSINEGWELGTNLEFGAYRDSGLADLWRHTVGSGKTSLIDFRPFEPDNNNLYAFLGTPLFDENGRLISIAVLKIGPEFITETLHSRRGMGKTGESYLVAYNTEEKNYSLRSDMSSMDYLTGYTHFSNLPYWDDARKAGLKGGEGTYQDSYGNEVLVAYSMVPLLDNAWYLISKINKDEVLSPIEALFRIIFISGLVLVMVVITGALFIASNITGPIIASKDFAYRISHGNLDGQLDFENRQDELGELGQSLNAMASQLNLLDWQKKGKEGLDDTLRGEWSAGELSGRVLRFIIEHLEAQMGGIYLTSQENMDQVELVASHAFIDRQGNFSRINRGEGIIGQALNETTPIYYTNPKEDVPSLNYGVAERIPPFFAVCPLIYETKVLGVFFVASMTAFDDPDREFLTNNLGNIAMSFNTTRSRDVIDSLLKNAQEQQEELRVINEELEEQTRALKESEEELQAQQEELRVTNEELEERTQALENQTASISNKNRELTRAQKEIEKKAEDLEVASKYKSEFLANMSHELRTPLNSILILSQLLGQNKDSNLSEKQIESAAAIHSSGSDLLKLINEILDLSKVEAGKIDLYLEEMTFSGLISDLQRVFKDLADEKKINFTIEQDSRLPQSIHTDSHRLQQILRNLLTNAFKFTEESGNVTLVIEKPEEKEAAAVGRQTKELIALRVRDNGTGIPEDKQAAIFEAFQQADGSTNRKYGGTGLGLSISRELSKLLGGNLTLESTAGEGSTFTLLTPSVCQLAGDRVPSDLGRDTKTDRTMTMGDKTEIRDPRELPNSEMLDSIDVRDDRSSAQPGEKSILIIEDDTRFAKILKGFAQERGYKCLLAEDGETGLHFADYYKPSGIILDIGLPGIDGWTVMERLKANPELRHIPVHFMSGSESEMDAMKMGAAGFMTKPVSLEKIEKAFTRIESLTSRSVRRLLVVEDNLIQRESIKDLIGDGDVETITAATGAEAYSELESSHFDCMILDLGLEDMSGYDLLEKIRANQKLESIPVIIYTGRDLTQTEETELRRYSESIIIKGAKSPERLLDETALFLHRVELELPQDKQRMLNINHDKNTIFRGKKILLVDDDMRNVFALTSVLEEKGMIVDVAKNGAESLEKISKETSLVLMDIMMPVMDGYEAMRRLRKNQGFKKTPIIALTAKAMKGDRYKSIEAGASDYLAKPIDTEKLLSMLRVWLYDR